MKLRLNGLFTRWRRGGSFKSGTDADQADDLRRVLSLNPTRIPSGPQWRLIPSFLSAGERRWMRIWLILAVISGLAVITMVSSSHLVTVPRAGGTVTIGLIGAPQFINPVLARENSVDASLSKLLFRGLTKTNDDLESVPDLAESVTVSTDHKTYTIVLRPDLAWSDGEPLTAYDIKFTIDTIKDTEFGSPYSALFQTAAVEVKDDRTAVVTIEKPIAAFPYYLDIGLLPYHAWSDATPQTMPLAELNVKPISVGPYKFQSVTKDRSGAIKSLTLVRNRNYTYETPFLNRVVVKFYADRVSAIDALNKESVDVIGGLTVAENQALAKKFSRTSFPISQITAVFLNQKANPVLKSKEVRQALAMTINRADLANSLFPGHVNVITGPVLPGYPGYLADLKGPAYDVAAANKLLEDAGWKTNKQGVRQKGAQQLVFAVTAPDDQSYNTLVDRLAESWRALGAGVEIKRSDPSSIQRDYVRPRKYEVLVFGEIYDADGDLYPFWDSSQQRDPGYNLSVYYNKKVDQYLEDAQSATTRDQWINDYKNFQTAIADDIPAIFLFQQLYVQAHRSALRGLSMERAVSACDRLAQVSNWYVKTKLTWR